MAQILEAWCPNWKLGAQIGQYLGARACAHPLCLVFDPWCACSVCVSGVCARPHTPRGRGCPSAPTAVEDFDEIISSGSLLLYALGRAWGLSIRDACTPASCGCACRGLVPSCARWCFRPPRCVSDGTGGRVFRDETHIHIHTCSVPTGTNTLIPCDPLCEPRWAGAVRAGSHGFVGSGPFLRRPVCTSPI